MVYFDLISIAFMFVMKDILTPGLPRKENL